MDLRYTFNEDVLNYDKMRPSYPQTLFEDIIRCSNIDSHSKVLEIGIGTGQATLPFLNTGCALTAVELGENMAGFVKDKFSAFKHFNVIHGDFEAVHLDNDSYDLVFSATAFHWIPEAAGYTKAFDILKSGGTLAVFWNHPSRPEDALHFAMQDVYKEYRPDIKSTVHQFSEEKCIEIAETIKKYGFIDAEYKLYNQTRFFDVQQYMSLINTYSDHRATPDDIRILVERELSDVINHYGGTVDLHDTIDLYLARKP